MAKRLLQLFLNGNDEEIEKIALDMNKQGNHVLFTPTSGPTALWVDNYELVGYNEVKRTLEEYQNAK